MQPHFCNVLLPLIVYFTLFERCKCSEFVEVGSFMKHKLMPSLGLDAISNAMRKMLGKESQVSGKSGVRYLEKPDQSFSDRKEYRSIVLPNGLHALLVSDPSNPPVTNSTNPTDQPGEKLAAAALSIGVGSFSDPRNVQGLAHFLEHMIFMGSKKYPSENEYGAYISKCGGFSNAMTDFEETTFFFRIDKQYLDGALDRFSNLFVAPLIKRDSISREREAVESEFQTKINIFPIMREQLLGSLGRNNHPCSSFSWGNLRTLKDNVTEDELYEILHKFQKLHYSAHRMHLAVQATMSLNELENLTVKYFSNIPSNNLPGDDFATFKSGDTFNPDFYNKVYFLKPKSDMCRLDVTWVLPPSIVDYKTKPVEYLSNLIGNEGKHSLTSYLRNRTLALDVHTGASHGFEKNSFHTLFSVTVIMTDKGLQNVEEILKAIYSYMRLLKETGPVESLFKELQELKNIYFRYRKEKAASENVEKLAVNMRYYPSKDIITGSELYYHYDADEIQTVIDNLNKPNFNIMISSSKPYSGIVYDKTEKWFGTQYAERDVPMEWRNLWENATTMPELKLQEPNQYISSNFTILAQKDDLQSALIPTFPEKIMENNIAELWYRQDHKFGLPISFMYFNFISPLPIQDAKCATLTALYASMLEFQIAEDLYPAKVAGLNYEIYATNKGIVVKVDGYNEKLPKIVDKITKAMRDFDLNMSSELFDVIKKKLTTGYFNEIIQAKKLNRDVRLKVVEETYWTTLEKLSVLKNLTIDDLSQFSKRYFQQIKIQSLIQGNTNKQDALHIMSKILANLKGGEIANKSLIESRARETPLGNNYLTVKSFLENDVNTVTTTYYQAGPVNPNMNSKLELLVMLLQEPLFDILRTKEQLAYGVSAIARDNVGILGFSVTVQSQEDKFTYQHIDERIDDFNNKFVQILTNMPEEDFRLVKNSLLKRKQIVDTDLKTEMNRNWAEIITEEYVFNRNILEMEHIKTITKQQIIDFFNQLVFDKRNRRKFSVQVVGCSSKSIPCSRVAKTEGNFEEKEDVQDFSIHYLTTNDQQRNYVTDIGKFAKSLRVYPVAKNQF